MFLNIKYEVKLQREEEGRVSIWFRRKSSQSFQSGEHLKSSGVYLEWLKGQKVGVFSLTTLKTVVEFLANKIITTREKKILKTASLLLTSVLDPITVFHLS